MIFWEISRVIAMIKVFIKDLFSKSQLIKYLLAAALIYYGLDYYTKNNELNVEININLLIYISLAIILTIYFFIKTYTSRENIEVYYALPFSKEEVNSNLILALILDTCLRKILLIFILFYYLGARLDYYILLLVITPIMCVTGSLPSSANIGKLRKYLTFLISIGLIAFLFFTYFKFDKIHRHISYIISLIIYIIFIKKFYLRYVQFSFKKASGSFKISIGNYFLKFILAENIYIVNTLGIIAMLIFLRIFMPGDIKLPISLAIATVNTPLLTIFSTDDKLTEYKSMLPETFKSLDKDYIKVLFSYFLLIHLIILGLNYKYVSIKLVGVFIALTIMDTAISFMMEKKYPIKGKKTTVEVWRSPRKYILGIIVFLLSFIIFVL